MTASPNDVVAFWRAAGPKKWYKKDAAFDAEITSRFSALWREAAAGALDGWEAAADSAFALVIVLDQFPRNMFRGKADAFATDAPARAVAEPARRNRGHSHTRVRDHSLRRTAPPARRCRFP